MAIQGNSAPSAIVSEDFDVEVIVLDADGLGRGANQACREVTVWPEEGKDVLIGGTVATAATGPPLADGISMHYMKIPIVNTNKLYFKGTAADKVYLLWRS